MSDTQSSRQVRILQTRLMEAQEISGPEEPALAPEAQPKAIRWKWITGGIVLALLAAAVAVTADQPSLAIALGLGSVICFVAYRSAGRRGRLPSTQGAPSPEIPRRVRISASRKEGRHGVLWRSFSKNCPACQTPLGRDATTTCTGYPAHVVHRRCKDLMQGKCPQCGNPLR